MLYGYSAVQFLFIRLQIFLLEVFHKQVLCASNQLDQVRKLKFKLLVAIVDFSEFLSYINTLENTLTAHLYSLDIYAVT